MEVRSCPLGKIKPEVSLANPPSPSQASVNPSPIPTPKCSPAQKKTSPMPPWFLTHIPRDKCLPGDSTLQLGPSPAPRGSQASHEPTTPSPGSCSTAATSTWQKGWEYLEQNEARAAMRCREGGWVRDRT